MAGAIGTFVYVQMAGRDLGFWILDFGFDWGLGRGSSPQSACRGLMAAIQEKPRIALMTRLGEAGTKEHEQELTEGTERIVVSHAEFGRG